MCNDENLGHQSAKPALVSDRMKPVRIVCEGVSPPMVNIVKVIE
jgi:hypothetical protein